MKKVLMLCYFFPPLSGPGVQRSSNFAQNLPQFGWEPFVISVKDISYVGRDQSLWNKVKHLNIYRTEALDPMRWLYLWEKARKTKQDDSIYKKAGSGIRDLLRNIFPIDSKTGWLPFAQKKALEICRTHKIDMIYASISPYSAGILAYKLSKKTGIPYVLDYRDLWRGKPDITYFSKWHEKMAYSWEKRIVKHAHSIIHVTQRSAEKFLQIYPQCQREKVSVIYNGFDGERINTLAKNKDYSQVRYVYAGQFYGGQSPRTFLQAIRDLNEEGLLLPELVIEFIGNYSREIEELFSGIPQVIRTRYLKYDDYLKKLAAGDVLLLFVASENSDMILTQKLFDYLAVRNPILGLLPPLGEAAEMIEKYSAGITADGSDVSEIKQAVLKMQQIIADKEVGKHFGIAENDYSRFERSNQAQELAGILDK